MKFSGKRTLLGQYSGNTGNLGKRFPIFFEKANMKKRPVVYTNNPKARDFFVERNIETHFVDGNYLAVLKEVQNKVHLNYCLLTHPLSGSIKPNETPYKSIAIHKENELDMLSLELISNAIDVYNKLQNDLKTPYWTENILDDFMVIDLDLIKNALI